jgi:hypothetical protein
VGDDQERDPLLLVDLAHEREDLVGGPGVEVAGRLVGQHQRRPPHQRAGDRHALLLPARQAPRVLVRAVAEADLGQGRDAAAPHLVGHARLVGGQRHHHVLHDGERSDEVMKLEHEAEVARAQPREGLVLEQLCTLAADPYLACRRAIEQTDEIEQGALARARGADHRRELAVFDAQVDAVEHPGDDDVAEFLGHAAKLEDWIRHCGSPSLDRVWPRAWPAAARRAGRSWWPPPRRSGTGGRRARSAEAARRWHR